MKVSVRSAAQIRAPSRCFTARPHCVRSFRSRSVFEPTRSVSTTSELPQLVDINEEFDARHNFSESANWLVPGYIMVGEYPFENGSTCKTHEAGEERLKQALKAGITAFAGMLSELPPQTEMPIRGVNNFVPYKPTADLIAAGISGPPPGEVVEGLRNPYIDNYLPKRRKEASKEYQAYKPLRPKYFHLGMVPDMSQIDADVLDKFLSDLEAEIHNGGAVYIHCTGGTGRAGVTAAALLVKVWGVSPEEALQRVQLSRNLRGDREDDGSFIQSPHNDEQKNFVKEFCKRYV